MWQTWLASAWLSLNCPDAMSPLFKKRKREKKKSQRKISCRLLCFANTGLFSRPLSAPGEAGDENGSFVPFPGAQLQRKCGSGNPPLHEGGRDRAVATVCGRSYINTACVDNAAGRMGAEVHKDFVVLAAKLKCCSCKQAVRLMAGRGRGGGCEWPCCPGSD